MDTRDLFLSCRRGDLERVKYLVEQKEVEVNIHDRWDSTPLYYACLCGHLEVVKYLLENGARCEANTFDGERCLYGALSQEIRSLLKNFKVVSSRLMRRELYYEFLRKLLEVGEYADVCFLVHGKELYTHRCVLSARSEYFHEMFADKWHGRSLINISHELVNPLAFQSVLQYLYTGQMETDVDNIEDVLRLAKQCRLDSLQQRLEEMSRTAHFFQSTKPGTHVTTILVESPPESSELRDDFSLLAEDSLPSTLRRWVGGDELPFIHELSLSPFADVVFEIEQHRFYCHQAFFCSRSDYFKAIVRNPLGETDLEEAVSTPHGGRLPLIRLREFTTRIFIYVLFYVYKDSLELDPEDAEELLMVADICLLPGLKRLCGAVLADAVTVSTVVPSLRLARLFQLPRLEDHCFQFIAENLEEMAEREDLAALICEDAEALERREDVDSIDVVDNVRFHLTASSMDEAHDKLQIIDSLLQRLGLDA